MNHNLQCIVVTSAMGHFLLEFIDLFIRQVEPAHRADDPANNCEDIISNPNAVVRRLRSRWAHHLDRAEFKRAMWEVQPALLSAIDLGVFIFFVWLNMLLIDIGEAKVFYVFLGAGFMTWLVGRNWLR